MVHHQRGQIELLILLFVVFFFAYMIGIGVFSTSKKSSLSSRIPPANIQTQCCDTGDGANCTPVATQSFTWENERYEHIKSNIIFTEGTWHLEPADAHGLQGTTGPNTIATLDNKRVFLNVTNLITWHPECGLGDDLVWKSGQCVGIPNDIVIYVCKTDCSTSVGTGEFDAYIRTSRSEQIPEVIANCDKNPGPILANPTAGPVVDQLVCPTGTEEKSLQLGSCKLIPKPSGSIPWLSPYCKPAIYLYPEKPADIHVAIAPKGELTLTIPSYPKNGWLATAFPNGDIFYQDKRFDYLYYEAEIPDTAIDVPKEGFVVAYKDLQTFFADNLPHFGLNEKEAKQFSDYWLKALPYSPYYFIGIIPPTNLHTIAPLFITPVPRTTIRLTPYFQRLEEKIQVVAPTILSPKRTGFTVVEWGGIVKTDANHSFSCLM